MRICLKAAVVALATMPIVSGQVCGQQAPQPQVAFEPQRVLANTPTMPDVYRLNMLIRSTVLALNQANATGNYTVLRDLAALSFQQSNNAAKLAAIFSSLRERKIDMTPVFFINPVLVRQPAIDAQGLLRMTGYFPSQPERINFDVLFQQVNGDWKLFGLAVSTSPAVVQASTATTQAPVANKPDAKPDAGTLKPVKAAPVKSKPAADPAVKATTANSRVSANPTQIDLSKPPR